MVALGFDRAFATILDSNVTTAIGALVLLEYGTGSIRGFALTLLVGIVVNVFTATFFMKVIFDIIMATRNSEKPIAMGLSAREIAEVTA